jgi:hypothetical protein
MVLYNIKKINIQVGMNWSYNKQILPKHQWIIISYATIYSLKKTKLSITNNHC